MAREPQNAREAYQDEKSPNVDVGVRVSLVMVTKLPPAQQTAWDRLWSLLLLGEPAGHDPMATRSHEASSASKPSTDYPDARESSGQAEAPSGG